MRTFRATAICLLLLGMGSTPATPARAADRPDLSGVWRAYSNGVSGGRGRTQWPEDAPYTDEARAKIADYERLVADTGATPGGFCLGTGMPGSMLGSGGYPMEIIQRPEQVTVIYEAHNELRRIYIDAEYDVADLFPTRNGFSTAHWEGGTLVVETISLKEALDQRSPHSEEARIVERYRLAGSAEDGRRLLRADLTLIDPKFYDEPVTVSKTWVAASADVRMLSYECTEPDWEDYLEQRRSELGL